LCVGQETESNLPGDTPTSLTVPHPLHCKVALLPSVALDAAQDKPFFSLSLLGYPLSRADEAVLAELRRWLRIIGVPEVDMSAHGTRATRCATTVRRTCLTQASRRLLVIFGRWMSMVWFEMQMYIHLSSLSTRNLLKLGINQPGSNYF